MQENPEGNSPGRGRVLAPFMEWFGLSHTVAFMAVMMIGVVIAMAVFWFFHSAPPRTLTITSGPPGSTLYTNAMKYARILESNHVQLKILESEGSWENLRRLENPANQVDIGFVQGGVTNGPAVARLMSLGSLFYEPLFLFYRSTEPVTLLSAFKEKRLAIGPEGSGTRSLALRLLELNGINERGPATLVNLDAEDAAKALLDGKVDVVFLMGDSASTQLMKQLLLAPGIRLFNFTQADGYTRRITYLNKLELPQGSIDFGNNIPAADTYLLGPTVELLARPNLHPALSDLLIEAAREVNGTPGLLRRKGEFPAPLEHDFPISRDATRYYKSGKTFLYRELPFWLASVVNRILVAFVPMIVVLIPAVRMIPAAYKWRMRSLIYRRYRALLALERELMAHLNEEEHKSFLKRLDQIEKEVNKMKVPASFAGQFYGLREHIDFVRERLAANAQSQ